MKNNGLNFATFAIAIAFMIISSILSWMGAIPVQDSMEISMLGIIIVILNDKK